MKVILACLVSSCVVGLVFAGYSALEMGFRVEMLGVAFVAFLYALVMSLLLGLPCRYLFRALGKEGGIYLAAVGAVVGTGFMIVPMVASFHADSSTLKTAAVLAIAGFCAGWAFDRVASHGKA